jgi:hypothetical protein
MSYDLPYNVTPESKTVTLETTGGKDIEGKGLDLNSDKILDAFWFHEKIDNKIIEVVTRLYINIGGRWTPVWYTYFKEL